MNILRDFERRLEGIVEGFFAKTFRAGVHPVELGRRILRDMEAGQSVGVNHVWVPNRYVFHLSPSDRAKFEQAEAALAAELRQFVRDGARERGWSLVGPPEVEFETDDSLGKGEFRCEASLVEGEDRPMTGEQQAAGAAAQNLQAFLHLIEDGNPTRTFALDKETITMGRLADCDIVLADPGVSRHHARIHRRDGAFVLEDLGSTNGTMVNEASVTERTLEEGDRITLGRTVLEFRRG